MCLNLIMWLKFWHVHLPLQSHLVPTWVRQSSALSAKCVWRLYPMVSHGCHSRVSISEQSLGFIKSNCCRRTYSATVLTILPASLVVDKYYQLRDHHKFKFKKSIIKN